MHDTPVQQENVEVLMRVVSGDDLSPAFTSNGLNSEG